MGASFPTWLKLLITNKFDVNLNFIPRVFAITLASFVLWPFVIYEQLKFLHTLKKTEIREDPIFILGHWRTGTTHLQNLMLNDKQFGYLNLIEGTFPHMILSNYSIIYKLMKPFIPTKRPMDNMTMTPEIPQEHEFVLTNLTLKSPLTALFFPKNRNKYIQYDSFDRSEDKDRIEWKNSLYYFLKKLHLKQNGKRLLLKNPFDTFRIKMLLDLFPNSKFINIYRDPYEVFFSTLKLHKTNTSLFWLQKPKYDLEKYIFTTYKEMYEHFYSDFSLIPEGNIIEIKYEDLIENPLEELKKIYSFLSIGDFSKFKDRVEKYVRSLANYQVSKYSISEEDKLRIYSHWHATIDRWGYEKPKK